jgi:hypothetical protein
MKKPKQPRNPADDAEAGHEAEAMLFLAEWINSQGDLGETTVLMDRAERDIPGKVERGRNKR